MEIKLRFFVDPQCTNWPLTKYNKTLQGTDHVQSSWDWKLMTHNNYAIDELHFIVRGVWLDRIPCQ